MPVQHNSALVWFAQCTVHHQLIINQLRSCRRHARFA